MKFVYMLGMFLMSSAYAGPIYQTACPGANKIKMPPKAGGYFMDNSCKRVYVLPPPVGQMSIIGVSTSDMSRCREIKLFNRSLKLINININNALQTNGEVDDLKIKDLLDQRRMITNEYADLSSTLGASVGLLFNNGIDDSVRDYKKLNSNTGFDFVSVELKNSKLSFNQANPFDHQLKSIVNQSLPILDLNEVGPGSFGVHANLNLNGACPLVDPFEGTIKKVKAEQLAGVVVPTMVYKYEIGATYTYKASYNLAALAQKMVNVSRKGGLFRTTSISTLIESNETSSWFKFEMTCDDSRVCDEAKAETALQIKHRLMQQVLDQISISTVGYVITPEAAGAPGQNGALAAADALKKCPNPYCQGAAVILDVASSIFGGTSKADNFIKSNNHFIEEIVSESRPVEFTRMMGFAAKKD